MTSSDILPVLVIIGGVGRVLIALVKIGTARSRRLSADRLGAANAAQHLRAFQGTVTANRDCASSGARIRFRKLTIACEDGTTIAFTVDATDEPEFPVGCEVVKLAGEPRLRLVSS